MRAQALHLDKNFGSSSILPFIQVRLEGGDASSDSYCYA